MFGTIAADLLCCFLCVSCCYRVELNCPAFGREFKFVCEPGGLTLRTREQDPCDDPTADEEPVGPDAGEPHHED